MEQVKLLLTKIMEEEQLLIQATLSNRRKKEGGSFQKVLVKPVEIKGERLFQFSYDYNQKVLHKNLIPQEAAEQIICLLTETFRQGLLKTSVADYQVLISKKGKVTILENKPTKTKLELSHNRQKKYLLQEGKPIPFLVELGVMNQQGKILAKRYDKFKQINRFLEIVNDVLPYLNRERKLHIVDFGCGKSYLTFALYHYLKEIQKLDIEIIGLDLKEDVIQHCNSLVQKFGYDNLHFLVGDIAQYNEVESVDMVVTLHACDTATDAALEKAIRWQADVILSVPCCQHELFKQVANPTLEPMLSHGIIKERFSALATDAVRAQLLAILGYKTQILEFIDLEHTPKNLLIRAVKTGVVQKQKLIKEYLQFKQFLQIDPYLERALSNELVSIGLAKKKQ